ncbi:SDR family NAD(P)-dependent oxidoreductase [Streptomyces tauricus]|uniref:SDR family NAD(P)-dependent oxidoreductase n=1 Tax=Streptomyces tauricus TaxID=68274 RepID=UPI0038214CD5
MGAIVMNPVYDFAGQVSFVTGASSGMGLATARAFAASGAAVALADIDDKAVHAAAERLADDGHQVLALVCDVTVEDRESPLYGGREDDVIVRGGRLHVKNDPARGESYQRLLARNNRSHLEVRGSYGEPSRPERHSISAYNATFAEVAVDATLGLVRVRRMLGVYDAGRIISPKLAESQAIGGIVGGIGQALLEHTVTDHRDGRITNANLADYLVPVNADVPDVKAIYLNGEDPDGNALGVKGLGEVVLVGVAPAIANAVFNATGRRIRELPINAEVLL